MKRAIPFLILLVFLAGCTTTTTETVEYEPGIIEVTFFEGTRVSQAQTLLLNHSLTLPDDVLNTISAVAVMVDQDMVAEIEAVIINYTRVIDAYSCNCSEAKITVSFTGLVSQLFVDEMVSQFVNASVLENGEYLEKTTVSGPLQITVEVGTEQAIIDTLTADPLVSATIRIEKVSPEE